MLLYASYNFEHVIVVEQTVVSEKNMRPTQATLLLLFVLRQKTQKLKQVSFIRF